MVLKPSLDQLIQQGSKPGISRDPPRDLLHTRAQLPPHLVTEKAGDTR